MIRSITTAAAAVGLILGAAACGVSSPAPSAADRGGPAARPASGAPITLAMISDEGGPVISFPELREGAQAAVQYVNNSLGGVDGRPLKLVTCASNATPASSAGCANRLINPRPVAFAGGVDLGTSASLPIIKSAGLAYIGGAPFGDPEMSSSNSVQFTGFTAGVWPALAAYAAQDLHARSAAVILPAGNTAAFVYQHYIVPVLAHFGVRKVKEILTNSQNPDYSTAIAAAAQANPDILMYIGASAGCVPVMQDKAQLGVRATLLVPGACSDPSLLKAAGAAANGVYFASDFDPVGSGNADVVTFETAMKKYEPAGVPMDEFTQAGFSSIINIQRAFRKIGASHLGTAAILREFRTGSNIPNFMAHPYTCDGRQVPGARAVCNAAQRILVIRNGKPTEVSSSWYDATPYIKP